MDKTTKDQLESVRIDLVNSLDKSKALRTAAVNAAHVIWKITHDWGHASQQADSADPYPNHGWKCSVRSSCL